MNFTFLHLGALGALEAGLLSMLAGALLYLPIHAFGRRHGWTHAGEIGRTFLLTLVVSASVDIWNLLYLGIAPMQSTVTIGRVLAEIHDPDNLGKRVMFEIVGALLGVVIGWLIWTGSLRGYMRGTRRH